jgi:sortase A
MKPPHKISTAPAIVRFNALLFAVIIAVNLYTIGLPFKPMVSLWLRQHIGSTSSRLSDLVNSPGITNGSVPVPSGKRLVIPVMLLDEQVYEGTSPLTVHKGVWRRPNTSTPDKGGNTVMTGHRFTYKGRSVFYELDKLKVGQRLAVFWDNHRYTYEVTEKKVVPPEQTEVEGQTKDSQLTLYTCTPLWSARNRLVIISKLVEKL